MSDKVDQLAQYEAQRDRITEVIGARQDGRKPIMLFDDYDSDGQGLSQLFPERGPFWMTVVGDEYVFYDRDGIEVHRRPRVDPVEWVAP